MAKIIEDLALRNRIFVFEDRFHAGEALAEKLEDYKGYDAYVLAIPAGGVPVGFVLSKRLELPLDVILIRKIHIPWNPEAGFGAISWDGIIAFNEPLLRSLGLTKEEVDQCIKTEKDVIKRRLKLFRGDKPFPNLTGKTAILVDDGMASGFSMLVAAKSIRQRKPKEIIVAVPTASESAIKLVKPYVNKLTCLNIRSGPIFAVADAYKVWYDLEDEDVTAILKMCRLTL
jgi:predicted phosphoribosyltransferase